MSASARTCPGSVEAALAGEPVERAGVEVDGRGRPRERRVRRRRQGRRPRRRGRSRRKRPASSRRRSGGRRGYWSYSPRQELRRWRRWRRRRERRPTPAPWPAKRRRRRQVRGRHPTRRASCAALTQAGGEAGGPPCAGGRSSRAGTGLRWTTSKGGLRCAGRVKCKPPRPPCRLPRPRARRAGSGKGRPAPSSGSGPRELAEDHRHRLPDDPQVAQEAAASRRTRCRSGSTPGSPSPRRGCGGSAKGR